MPNSWYQRGPCFKVLAAHMTNLTLEKIDFAINFVAIFGLGVIKTHIKNKNEKTAFCSNYLEIPVGL